jgi:hypothetical protein
MVFVIDVKEQKEKCQSDGCVHLVKKAMHLGHWCADIVKNRTPKMPNYEKMWGKLGEYLNRREKSFENAIDKNPGMVDSDYYKLIGKLSIIDSIQRKMIRLEKEGVDGK